MLFGFLIRGKGGFTMGGEKRCCVLGTRDCAARLVLDVNIHWKKSFFFCVIFDDCFFNFVLGYCNLADFIVLMRFLFSNIYFFFF